MTKDGVRDFIAAEYALSENYVHGLAAFGPRLKNFESPHSSRGSSPGLPAGNSVNGRFLESRICFLARRRGVVRLSFLITVKINMRGVDINDQCRSLPGPALEKMRCFRLARSSASKKQQLRRSRSCRVIEFSNLQRVELPAASLTPSAERKPSSSVMTSWSAKSSNPQIGDGQQPRHHGGDKPPVGDLHAAADPISCCCLSRIHEKVFCFVFVVEKY